MSYLYGPDNGREYRAFAHITADGAARLAALRYDGAMAEARALLAVGPGRAPASVCTEACAVVVATGCCTHLRLTQRARGPSSEAWDRTAPELQAGPERGR